MSTPWQARLDQQTEVEGVQRTRYLTQFTVGRERVFRPRSNHERSGHPVTVIRAPRLDVKNPSVRVQFADGTQLTVPPGQLAPPERQIFRPGERDAPSPVVEDARRRPAWSRLLKLAEERHQLGHQLGQVKDDLASAQSQDEHDLAHRSLEAAEQLIFDADATLSHRLAQLAGMVAPRGDAAARSALIEELQEHLQWELVQVQEARAGRLGHPVPPAVVLPSGTDLPDPERLDQEQRVLINGIARCIHRRYFLSDADVREKAPEKDRAKRLVASAMVRQAGQAEGASIEQPAPKAPRGSVLHGEADEARLAMNAAATQVCQYLTAGQHDLAAAQLVHWQAAQRQFLQAERVIAQDRGRGHTGRFFHGEILSVRQSDDGGGMTQWYTRLTVLYGANGHEVLIANARELEARTNTRVGRGWADLCRWIEDHAERLEGKKQGRRMDDDETLIYRENEERLTLRGSVRRKYPDLPLALECVRRSLTLTDVRSWEIPPDHPAPGYHPPQAQASEEGH